MSAAARCAKAIRSVGCVVELVRDDVRVPFIASIQPRTVSDEPEAGPLGFSDKSRYTLYAPCDGAGESLAVGDALECHGHRYLILRTEVYRLKDEAVYRWASLRREEPA